MNDLVGKTISHYRILEQIGAGGMGEVYLAEDTELDRKVALKFLPPHYTEDPDINARFKREAKAAAALNHPNIITIYEVGEHEGKAFIAMEYVEGQSLREMMNTPLSPPSRGELKGGVSNLRKVVDLASQICEGLREAHQAGIVHRDIKPDNILIDAKGRVKIADFGLAKAHGRTQLTEEGSTLGTLDYMSPEQARGEEVDHRSDIWSFGVVLYEMITGQLPFEGEYDAAVTYSIAHEDPEPLARYKTGVSDGLQRIIDKALDKEKETRYQNISDLLADLKREKRDSSTAIKPVGKKTRKAILSQRGFALAGLVLVAFITIFAIDKLTREPTKQILATHTQLTFTGKASYPAISPDGKYMAYISGELESDGDVMNAKVMVQDLSGGQALEIASGYFGGAHGWGTLRWSPAGSELLFGGSVGGSRGTYIIPRLGGSARRIRVGLLACWSSDGSIIAGSALAYKRIWFTDTSTGDTSSISLAGDFDWLAALDWSSLGDRLLYLTVGQKRHTIRTIKTDGSQQQMVVEDSVVLKAPHWSGDGGNIYYFRSNAQTKDLLKIKVDLASGRTEGPPHVLQTGLQTGDIFSLSNDGKRLLYTRGLVSSNLWLVTLEGEAGAQTIQTKQLTTGTFWLRQPRISPDGKKVAFSVGSRPKANICVMPIEGGPMQQLTFLDSYNSGAVWSTDGQEIAFGSTEGGQAKIWRVSANGGTPRQFKNSEISDGVFGLTWSPGHDILYHRPGNRNFHILDPKTEEERALVANDSVGWMFSPRYSPDEDKVAVFWNRFQPRGSRGLWLVSVADSSQTLLHKGSWWPIEWSEDGQWIYAWDRGQKPHKIIMVSVKSGESKTLVTLPFDRLDSWSMPTMTPDGKHIVCAVTEAQSDIWLMENFDPEVK
ncbi:MAG: protein kinase [bacterium]